MTKHTNHPLFWIFVCVTVLGFSCGCVKSFPRELVIKKNLSMGACLGSIADIRDTEKAYVIFQTPDGKGSYKVKTDKQGLFALNRKSGTYRLLAYRYVDASGTVEVILSAPLEVEILGGQVRYVGKLFTSPVSKDIYLLDDFVRDEPALRNHFGQDIELRSGFPNEAYYALMRAHRAHRSSAAVPSSSKEVSIPGTTFLMGDVWPGAETTLHDRPNLSEIPPHQVELSDYVIDREPVTYRQLSAFADSAGIALPPDCLHGRSKIRRGEVISGWEDKPATCVPWTLADHYCQSQGKHLPTEAQWELAVRGKPWGDRNFGGINEKSAPKAKADESQALQAGGWISAFGVQADGDVVAEWVADRYAVHYFSRSPSHNPSGPQSGRDRIVRAGPYRFAVNPQVTSSRIGFRCAAFGQGSAGFGPRPISRIHKAPSTPSDKPSLIVKKKANVMESPAVASAVVAEVKPGQMLESLGHQAGWYRVRLSDGRVGYLYEDFAKKAP